MFEISITDVKKDIAAHLSAGGFPFCALPSFAPHLKTELASDFKTLLELSQAADYKVMAIYLEDYLDYEQGRKQQKPVFKTEKFHRQCYQNFGENFRDVLIDTGVIHPNGEIDFLQPSNKRAGCCYNSRDNSKTIIFTTLTNQNPLLSAKVMYHEFGHAIHRRRCYFKDDSIYPMINRFSKEFNEAPEDNRLKFLLKRLHSYKSMLHECFANTFALTALMIKTQADPEITRKLLNQSAASFCHIMNDPDANPAYCDFPITEKISEKITNDFAAGKTDFYYNQDGSINFKNAANMSAAAVKSMAYSKEEYFEFADYSWLDDEQKKQAAQNDDFTYYTDYLDAQKYLVEHKAKPSKLNALSSLLLQLRNQEPAQNEASLEEYSNYGIADHINDIRLEITKAANKTNQRTPAPLTPQQLSQLNSLYDFNK